MPLLTAELSDFVDRYLRTVEDLQVLMACVNERDRWWDAKSIARQLAVTSAAAGRALDHLARGNLLDIRVRGEVRYQFHPGTDELERHALACAAAYRLDPASVTTAVANKSRTPASPNSFPARPSTFSE